MISGTTHAGDTRSRKRRASAMSVVRSISSAGMESFHELAHVGVDEPRAEGHRLDAVGVELLFIATVYATTAAFVAE